MSAVVAVGASAAAAAGIAAAAAAVPNRVLPIGVHGPRLMAAAPMALMHQPLPPVVIAMPHRGVTASTGIESLCEQLDAFADELVLPMPTQPLPSSLPSSFSQPFVSNVAPPPMDTEWHAGQRVEFSMDAREAAALHELNALSKGQSTLFYNGVNLLPILQKVYAHSVMASTSADRFQAEKQQAYTTDIPQLRQRVINAEQALHEANLRGKSLGEQVVLHNAYTGGVQVQPRILPLGAVVGNTGTTTAKPGASAGAAAGAGPALSESEMNELHILRRQRDALIPVLQQVREALVCPICTEVALLPKVLGACGHVACQTCLKQLDDVAFATLTSSTGGASARQHLMARRCPLCRMEIVGGGFPVHPLREVASTLVTNQLIEPSDTPAAVSAHSSQRLMEFKSLTFEKESPEAKHIHALQMGCYAQSQIAQHSVSGVVAAVTNDQWINGVYVLFEAAVSRVFFETFATTLHGKAGGINVLVNSAQRTLAVQLADRNKQRRPADTHLLVKVATDGRFAIGHTPEPKDENRPEGGGNRS